MNLTFRYSEYFISVFSLIILIIIIRIILTIFYYILNRCNVCVTLPLLTDSIDDGLKKAKSRRNFRRHLINQNLQREFKEEERKKEERGVFRHSFSVN